MYIGGGGVRIPGGASFSGGGVAVFQASQDSWFHHNTQFLVTGSAPNVFTRHDPGATIQLNTDETALSIEAVSHALGGSAPHEVGIWVNKVYNQTVIFTATDVKQTQAVTLPAGQKLVEIVEMGAYVTGITSKYTPVIQGTPVASLIVVGDSISVGETASPVLLGWDLLWRQSQTLYDSVPIFGQSGQLLHGIVTPAGTFTATVAHIMAGCTGSKFREVYIALGVNDFNAFGTSGTAASHATEMGQLLDAIHAADPTVRCLVQTLILFQNVAEGSEGVNAQGELPSLWRSSIAAVVAARSTFCALVDGRTLVTPGNVSDPHPTTAGHAQYAVNVVPYLRPYIEKTAPEVFTGGATVTNPVPDPRTIAGIQALFVPDTSNAVADGTAAATVANLDTATGHALWDATQATAGQRPLIKTGQSPNGKRVLRFDGIDDLIRPAGSVTLAQTWHLFFFAKILTKVVGAQIHDGVSASNTAALITLSTATPPALRVSAGVNLNANSGSQPNFNTQFQLIEVLWKGASSTITMGGVVQATGDAGAAAANGFTWGCRGDGATAFCANFDLAGAAYFNRELTGTDLANMRIWSASL